MKIQNPFTALEPEKYNIPEEAEYKRNLVQAKFDKDLQRSWWIEQNMFFLILIISFFAYVAIHTQPRFFAIFIITFAIFDILYAIFYKIAVGADVYYVRQWHIRKKVYYTNLNAFLTNGIFWKSIATLFYIGTAQDAHGYTFYTTIEIGDVVATILSAFTLFTIIQIDMFLDRKKSQNMDTILAEAEELEEYLLHTGKQEITAVQFQQIISKNESNTQQQTKGNVVYIANPKKIRRRERKIDNNSKDNNTEKK